MWERSSYRLLSFGSNVNLCPFFFLALLARLFFVLAKFTRLQHWKRWCRRPSFQYHVGTPCFVPRCYVKVKQTLLSIVQRGTWTKVSVILSSKFSPRRSVYGRAQSIHLALWNIIFLVAALHVWIDLTEKGKGNLAEDCRRTTRLQ